jgi:hypothetical protein
MRKRSLLRSLLALVAFVGAGEGAFAQMEACQRYRAELAALERGSGQEMSAAAERQRVEIARLDNYFRSIGCGQRGIFGGMFGGGQPAECGAIAQRLRQMQANYANIIAQDRNAGNLDARRRQLQVAIDQTCNAEHPAFRGPRGFFESLFGAPRGRQPLDPERLPEDPEALEANRPLGGRRLVCVRSCDGYFFPLSNGSRENADSMCQALCPGAETAAFAMPGSDDALDRAVSLRGMPYVSTPNAFKFQKTFDDSCSCKKNGQSWAQILRRAESMIEQRRGDIIVTAEKSEELSRPKVTPAQAREKDRKAAERKIDDAAESEEAAQLGASAPTASQDSSGIGPRSIETNRVVRSNEGPRQNLTTGDGSRRPVRVIAPDVIPVPESGRR